MKLFYCEATAIDYDPRTHIIAESEQEAEEQFTKLLDENEIWHAGVIVVNEVELEGYEIVIKKKN